MPWEENPETIRSGHGNPDRFDQKSFRTIDITEGVQAVIGCPKGNFENGKCKTGTEVQSYLFSKPKFTMKEAKAWFKEHEGGKKEEREMDEKLSWIQEIEQAFRAMDEETPQIIEGEFKPFLIDVDKIEASLVSFVWTASFYYNAGTMMAELLPDFKTENVNGFYLHPSLKEKIIKALNSGKVFLRDAHSRATKDIVGIVNKGYEKDGKIFIESDVTDPKISRILSKYSDKLGVSIGGQGIGYCTECNKRVMGMTRCLNHPKAPIVVKEFELTEISLTSDPAWSTSKVENYV